MSIIKNKIFYIIILQMVFFQLLFSNDEYKIEKVTRDDKVIGEKIVNLKGDTIKEYLYVSFENGKPTVLDIISRGKRVKKVGELNIVYNNDKKLFTVERDLKGNVNEVSYFYMFENKFVEEKRDGNGKLLQFLEHKDDETIVDITDEMVSKRILEKLTVTEKNQTKVLKSLDSLKLIVSRDKKALLAQTLIPLNTAKSAEKDVLISQIVTDSIKEYTNTDFVLVNAGLFQNKIDIGNIYYENIKNILTDHKLYTLNLYGYEIIELFKNIDKLPKGHREFPNTANLMWEKLKNDIVITINGEPLDKYKLYSLTVNEYIKNGNGVYFQLKDKLFSEIPYDTELIVADYLSTIDIIDDSYVLEDRIK
ncbi:MAG: ushA1 [Fusobacteriales bacterium]|jgi:hypothetical protein|nr:ushA1 [Fusobacteriales bacterium]